MNTKQKLFIAENKKRKKEKRDRAAIRVEAHTKLRDLRIKERIKAAKDKRRGE